MMMMCVCVCVCVCCICVAIEISDVFGCTISKHRCEWSKIMEGSNDRKLKVKRPCSRFHKWFEHQRSEDINLMVRLLHKYHITGNMYWRRIKKGHERVTKIKMSWYATGLVTELYGRKRQTPSIKWYSSSWASEDLQLVTWLEKKRSNTKNPMNNRGVGTKVVTCGVIWEVITKLSGRCCPCAYTNQIYFWHRFESAWLQWAPTVREERENSFALIFYGNPFSILGSEVKDIYKAVSNITNASGLMKTVNQLTNRYEGQK